MTYDKQELEIVEMDPCTHREIRHYANLKEVCTVKKVSKQALHQAIEEGDICAGSRWTLRKFYSAK